MIPPQKDVEKALKRHVRSAGVNLALIVLASLLFAVDSSHFWWRLFDCAVIGWCANGLAQAAQRILMLTLLLRDQWRPRL